MIISYTQKFVSQINNTQLERQAITLNWHRDAKLQNTWILGKNRYHGTETSMSASIAMLLYKDAYLAM